MLKNVELIEKYEKEFLGEREEFVNFVDESYKNRDYFPGVKYLSKEEKKDLSKNKLRNLVREIAKQEKNEIIDKKGEYLISVKDLKVKYEFINEIFIINDLDEVKDLRDYLTIYDFAKRIDEIEIKNGNLNLLEFNVKETNLANLNGNYEIFRMEIGLKNTLIIVKR